LTATAAAEAWVDLPDKCTGTSTPVLAPGSASATLTINFTTPGNYEYLSSVGDDAFAGMKGVLTVK
jgi:plastocyanin